MHDRASEIGSTRSAGTRAHRTRNPASLFSVSLGPRLHLDLGHVDNRPRGHHLDHHGIDAVVAQVLRTADVMEIIGREDQIVPGLINRRFGDQIGEKLPCESRQPIKTLIDTS